jgi:chemotaxis protein methyltransferase CheR
VGLRFEGFQRVRGQVTKRLKRRLGELGLGTLEAYRVRLESDPAELALAATFCRVTISRFFRDRAVFEHLRRVVLPDLAARGRPVRAWSAGCASGEEPYTLRIIWDVELAPRGAPPFEVVATDAGAEVLERARRAVYERNSLKELPAALREAAFIIDEASGLLRLRDELRAGVELRQEDLRVAAPPGPFHLVLCRNLAFSYYDDASQLETARRIAACLEPGGLLVLGAREVLPAGAPFTPAHATLEVHRRL